MARTGAKRNQIKWRNKEGGNKFGERLKTTPID